MEHPSFLPLGFLGALWCQRYPIPAAPCSETPLLWCFVAAGLLLAVPGEDVLLEVMLIQPKQQAREYFYHPAIWACLELVE